MPNEKVNCIWYNCAFVFWILSFFFERGVCVAMRLLCLFVACVIGLRIPLLGNYSETFFWFTTVSVGGESFTVCWWC